MLITEVIAIFARAGGGGSGGRGFSGGFSGSHGSGGGEGILIIVPPMVAICAASYIRSKTNSIPAGLAVGLLVGTAASALFFMAFDRNLLMFVVSMIANIIGVAIGASYDQSKLSRFRKNNKTVQSAIQKAAENDSAWDPEEITKYATQIFMRFQHDWVAMDTKAIRAYATTRYFNHAGLMLYAMRQMNRKNTMQNIKIKEVILTDVHDDADDHQDRVSVGILAKARDSLVDSQTGKRLTTTNEEFDEQWNFVRSGDTWLLDSIDQSTEDSTSLVKSLREFAASNQMYFSPDWGRLLLPTGGELFRRGFANTDINNHVIGFWDGDLLVQLYTYKMLDNNSSTDYLIGQITLPKSYGGIIVKRRGRLPARAPRKYKKVTLEWGDFNKRYAVFATDENQVTSFELLNPSFMAWLYDQNLKVNIEVVGDTVYLYAKLYANERRYAEMLEILKRSHKELKM